METKLAELSASLAAAPLAPSVEPWPQPEAPPPSDTKEHKALEASLLHVTALVRFTPMDRTIEEHGWRLAVDPP